MPFQRRRPDLSLSAQESEQLEAVSRSRVSSVAQVQRARILLAYAKGASVSEIARSLNTNRPKVERCIDKALQLGALVALSDLPRKGRGRAITLEAESWVRDLACHKPNEFGYSYELWTTALLAKHVREHCMAAGHPCLSRLGRGTVSKLLARHDVRPHKIKYYLERRDEEFESKMAQVLCVYRDVALMRERGDADTGMVAVLSYDEKPGIQAIGATAPDLPPVPGENPTWARDYEYVRHGTVSLMAAIDLLNGKVHGIVVDRHRSKEFVEFLQLVHNAYPPQVKIRMILDNHSAHVSKETRQYLATIPNRYEFIFTPKHGSWLNLIETFFSKMTRSMLRGIRVASKEELRKRIETYLDEVNASPVVFRWKYGLDELANA